MIRKEYYKTLEDGTVLIRTYPNRNHYIIQDGTGIEYTEAIDPEHMNRTYTESERALEDVVEERQVTEQKTALFFIARMLVSAHVYRVKPLS